MDRLFREALLLNPKELILEWRKKEFARTFRVEAPTTKIQIRLRRLPIIVLLDSVAFNNLALAERVSFPSFVCRGIYSLLWTSPIVVMLSRNGCTVSSSFDRKMTAGKIRSKHLMACRHRINNLKPVKNTWPNVPVLCSHHSLTNCLILFSHIFAMLPARMLAGPYTLLWSNFI